ncbi:hypothetical protein [Streptomyces sp. NPDC058620]|uniref:hypothetical protein n=1 Tax=Streptomyces sp. NPDC058620 TaxID=3346560 RepID=UPI003646AAF6
MNSNEKGYAQTVTLGGGVAPGSQENPPDQAFPRQQEEGSGLASPKEASEGYTLTCTPDGDVMVHLPEITYLDTQQWAVDVGLMPEALVQLRDAIDTHLRCSADHAGPANRRDIPTVATDSLSVTNGNRVDIDTVASDRVTSGHSVVAETVTTYSGRESTHHLVVGQQPTTVKQQPTVVSVSATETTVAQQATVALRDRLRVALRRHIDPDDDTMPALDFEGFVWVPADEVLDDLVKAIAPPRKYPLTTHAYEGYGSLHPCTAVGYGSMCGSAEWDHMEEQ